MTTPTRYEKDAPMTAAKHDMDASQKTTHEGAEDMFNTTRNPLIPTTFEAEYEADGTLTGTYWGPESPNKLVQAVIVDHNKPLSVEYYLNIVRDQSWTEGQDFAEEYFDFMTICNTATVLGEEVAR